MADRRERRPSLRRWRRYLDHASTTPLRPEALAAMLPYLTEKFGNPSGSHALARAARSAIDDARDDDGRRARL